MAGVPEGEAVAEPPAIGPIRAPKASGVVEKSLAGGLHAIVARRSEVPMVELRLGFPLAAELIGRPAAIEVLSESLLAGTDRHDRAGLASAVQRIGGRLGAGVAGDWIVVSGSVLAEHLVQMLGIVGEVLAGASYPGPEVSADRDRMAEQVQMALSQPEVIADQELSRRLFGRHPYASGLPSPAALRHVSASQLRRLHRETFAPSLGHFVLVGDVTPSRTLAAAAGAFEPWLAQAPGAAAAPLDPLPALRLGPLQLFDRPGAVQSNIRMARLAPGRTDPLWPATALANLIFGGMFSSRLVDNLREKNGYAYSPRTSFSHGRAGSSFVIQADVATGSTAASFVETGYELGRVATKGVTDEELESARRYALGSLSFETATQEGLASRLATLAVTGLDPGYLGRYPASLKRVKRHEVDDAARLLLAPSQMVTVVLGDADLVAGSLGLVAEVHSRQLSARRPLSGLRASREPQARPPGHPPCPDRG